MIPTAELEALRATQEQAMPETAAAYRPAGRIADGRGGIVAGAPALIAGELRARLAKPTAGELTIAAERFGRMPTWVATLPAGAGVTAGDHLELDLETGALTLLVLGHLSAPATWTTADRLACVEAN